MSDMPEKLWEVRSTTTVVLKTTVRARTRDEAKEKSAAKKMDYVSEKSTLTANQTYWGWES